MKNHMAAFQTVIEHLDQQFDGTVIRIPLRTQAQATESEISSRATTTSEVRDVLRNFSSEFGDSGLLFMRNIEKLEVRAEHISIEIKVANGENLRS
jgi:sacsin